jgi:hypothetical protein
MWHQYVISDYELMEEANPKINYSAQASVEERARIYSSQYLPMQLRPFLCQHRRYPTRAKAVVL